MSYYAKDSNNTWVKIPNVSAATPTPQTQKGADGTYTVTSSDPSLITIDVGFQPRYVCIRRTNSSGQVYTYDIYDESWSTTQFRKFSSSGVSSYNLNSDQSTFYNVTSSGFTMNRSYSSYNEVYYFAVE